MRLRETWHCLAILELLAGGSCSIDRNYEFEDEPGGSGGAPSAGGAVAAGPGGSSVSSGAAGTSCNDRPCKNGGTCHQGATGFACGCPSGFSGPTCEEGTNGGRSGASGGRASTGSGGAPAATGGYTASGGLQGTGGFDNPCFPNPCLNNGYCMLEGEDYRCDCNGYEGRLCENDLDECAQDPGPCGADETCRNYVGSFGCPCLAGFTGDNCDLPILEWFTLPEGFRACTPTDVSSDGKVVVGYCTVTPTGKRAFLWTHAEGISLVGTLGAESSAEAVNADGSVIVGTYIDDAGRRQMFRWTSASGMRSETALESENGSDAYDVNGDGSVVVGVSYPGRGFRWTPSERLALGTVENGGAIAWGVSGDGSIVVGESEGAAFRWTAVTGMQPLPESPKGGQTSARAISEDGRIIVGLGVSQAEGWGLIWRDGGVEVLERFGNQIRGVSNTGIVLGGTVVWSGEVRTAEQALQDAGVVLDQNVSSITSISPDGRYWVGYGAGGGFLARIVKGG